jgi:hypothetical protein
MRRLYFLQGLFALAAVLALGAPASALSVSGAAMAGHDANYWGSYPDPNGGLFHIFWNDPNPGGGAFGSNFDYAPPEPPLQYGTTTTYNMEVNVDPGPDGTDLTVSFDNGGSLSVTDFGTSANNFPTSATGVFDNMAVTLSGFNLTNTQFTTYTDNVGDGYPFADGYWDSLGSFQVSVAAPEPTTLGLLGAAALLGGARRMRRKA